MVASWWCSGIDDCVHFFLFLELSVVHVYLSMFCKQSSRSVGSNQDTKFGTVESDTPFFSALALHSAQATAPFTSNPQLQPYLIHHLSRHLQQLYPAGLQRSWALSCFLDQRLVSQSTSNQAKPGDTELFSRPTTRIPVYRQLGETRNCSTHSELQWTFVWKHGTGYLGLDVGCHWLGAGQKWNYRPVCHTRKLVFIVSSDSVKHGRPETDWGHFSYEPLYSVDEDPSDDGELFETRPVDPCPILGKPLPIGKSRTARPPGTFPPEIWDCIFSYMPDVASLMRMRKLIGRPFWFHFETMLKSEAWQRSSVALAEFRSLQIVPPAASYTTTLKIKKECQ